MERILLVEDDKMISQSLYAFLTQEGFAAACVSGQRAARELLEKKSFDLALLDISLEDGNGFSLCGALRQEYNLPVIFLTASGDEYSVVAGFDMGAEDYIRKPFRPRELVSRIRAVLRRTGRGQSIMDFYGVRVDTNKAVVVKDGQELALSALEYRLLLLFCQNKGQVLTRERLLSEMWDMAG